MNAPTIAIDYTSGPGHAPGVGRYVRELVRAHVRLPAQGAFGLELLEVGRAPRPMEGPALGLDDLPEGGPGFTRRITRLPRRLIAQGTRAPRLARALMGPSSRAGLLHRVIPAWPPVGPLPHSIAVAEFPPQDTGPAQRLAAACQNALGVIVFSQDAAERVEALYGVDPGRIHRSPVGSEHWERDLAGRTVEPRSTRDVLVLGAIRRARRPLHALAAFGELLSRNVEARLLFVGRPGDQSEAFHGALGAFRAKHPEHSVRWIQDPKEALMPECVAGSTALLHLADDEASPVTPLEAARMGLPVVASPLPAFEEALGSTAAFVDSADPAATADALAAALEHGSNQDGRGRSRRRAEPFTWAAAARAHCEAWKLMLESP